MGSGTVYQGGSYYQGLFPGPTGPPNESWPDADAPINSSDVTNSNVPPQIVASAPYIQPGTDAPSDNPQIDASSSVAKPGPETRDRSGRSFRATERGKSAGQSGG